MSACPLRMHLLTAPKRGAYAHGHNTSTSVCAIRVAKWAVSVQGAQGSVCQLRSTQQRLSYRCTWQALCPSTSRAPAILWLRMNLEKGPSRKGFSAELLVFRDGAPRQRKRARSEPTEQLSPERCPLTHHHPAPRLQRPMVRVVVCITPAQLQCGAAMVDKRVADRF